MKSSIFVAVALSLSTTIAFAADVPTIKPRALVKTANGARVGFIDRVVKDEAGTVTSVQIIYRGRFVKIPASTLTAAEKGLVTTLTTLEVNKL